MINPEDSRCDVLFVLKTNNTRKKTLGWCIIL